MLTKIIRLYETVANRIERSSISCRRGYFSGTSNIEKGACCHLGDVPTYMKLKCSKHSPEAKRLPPPPGLMASERSDGVLGKGFVYPLGTCQPHLNIFTAIHLHLIEQLAY